MYGVVYLPEKTELFQRKLITEANVTNLVQGRIVGVLQEAPRLILGQHCERRVDGDIEALAHLGEFIALAREDFAPALRSKLVRRGSRLRDGSLDDYILGVQFSLVSFGALISHGQHDNSFAIAQLSWGTRSDDFSTYSQPFRIRSFRPWPRPVTAALPPRATAMPVRIADFPPVRDSHDSTEMGPGI